MSLTTSDYLDEAGEFVGILLSAKVIDVEVDAEQRLAVAAQEAAARADELAFNLRLKTGLLNSLGHDLRTPLAVISSSSAALIADAALPPADTRELLRHIQSSAQALDHLLENLLDVHRIEIGTLAVRRDAVPLLDALEDPLRSVGVGVHLAIPDDLPALEGDLGLLERVLENLLQNAVRHSPPGTPVTVTARRVGDEAEIAVVDRGAGVPTDRYPDLFAPFHKLDVAAEGLGVGLSVAHAFAEAMGMTLTPTATPGGGLTMTLRTKVVR